MRRFLFKLQPLLAHRERLEEEAKNAFLDKQAEILEIEAQLHNIRSLRSALLNGPILNLGDHRDLESRLLKSDDDERIQKSVLAVLQNESDKLRFAWLVARQDLEAVLKLRERAVDEWQYEADREEQNALDEWSTQKGNRMRRSA